METSAAGAETEQAVAERTADLMLLCAKVTNRIRSPDRLLRPKSEGIYLERILMLSDWCCARTGNNTAAKAQKASDYILGVKFE